MRILRSILVVCAAAALTACNTTANQTQAAATPGAQPAKTGEPKICRTDPDTGTRIAARECHTEAEWAAIARQSEDTITTQGAMRPSGAPTSSLSGGAP